MRMTGKEVYMHVNKQKYMVRFIEEELLSAINNLQTMNSLKLFLYYATKSDGWVFKPEEMAEATGMSVRTIQTAKKELIAKGYLYIDHGKRSDHYYLGKEMVDKFKLKYGVLNNGND